MQVKRKTEQQLQTKEKKKNMTTQRKEAPKYRIFDKIN